MVTKRGFNSAPSRGPAPSGILLYYGSIESSDQRIIDYVATKVGIMTGAQEVH
jgi:hypothetical protein